MFPAHPDAMQTQRRTPTLILLLSGLVVIALVFVSRMVSLSSNGRSSSNATRFSPTPSQTPATPSTISIRSKPPTSLVADHQTIRSFRDWSDRYAIASPAERAALTAEGIQRATERRAGFMSLIQTNPEEAIRQAVPMTTRQQLPEDVVDLLEERVSGRGEFAVIAALPEPGMAGQVPPVDRFATLNDKVYHAYVYGQRVTQTSRQNTPLHGVAINDQLAIHESPVRVLEPGEIVDSRLVVTNPDEICGISKLPSNRAAAAQVGNEIVYLCTGSHIAAFSEQQAAADNPPIILAGTGWTFGTKTMLFMRLNFSDDLAESISEVAATNLMNSVSNWFAENSYDNTAIDATITPLLTMPKTKAWYQTNDNYYALLTDARAVARTNGFDTANFNLDCIHFKSVFSGWSGRGYVGSKGTWLQSGTSVGVACHEFGHNYGLWHANYWDAPGDTIIGPGNNVEYGNPFDTMGSASAGDYQFNAFEKNVLQWLPGTHVATITNSGTYRVYAFDAPALSNDFSHALKIKKDSRFYWVEVRRKFTSNKWIQNGVLLNWSAWTSSAGGSHLLDTTPGSVNGKTDSAVVVGRTFSDPFAGVHITSIRRNTNTTPASMDVVVNLGTFPDNHPPIVSINAGSTSVGANTPINFSATASDADADELAYAWDFGDQNFGTNGPAASKSWGSSGDYVVRCTVSDMKGGTASASILVTVGSPTTYRIAGNITAAGQPVEGVRISVSSSKVTYTDSFGDYILTGLSSGANTVSATKAGYTFAPTAFSNPITVGPNATGVDFSAQAGVYVISGRVTDNNASVAGVTVSVGGQSTTTDSGGKFVLTNMPAGAHLLTASKPGYELLPNYSWSNPVGVEWGNATNKNFERPLFYISGTIGGINGNATVSIGDTNHQAVAYLNRGVWNYSLSVPRGQWNLVASLPGYTISPGDFSNPVTITNSSGSGGVQGGTGGTTYNFSAATGTTFLLSGNVTAAGQPLPGVFISAGSKSGFTDTAGNYTLTGVINGSYTVSASLTDYLFAPATRSSTVASANLSGQNFDGKFSVWMMQPAPTANGFRFTFSGGSNRVFRVESSTNLVNWETLAVVTNTTSLINLLDPASGNGPRFYRTAVLP
ncbi:MAG: carboxypeptidase regulatory-like domain-containing protein [Opitutaceae bacterium]|nr:carboxypeptidase regulatory-like domain-containing protein [Verrucomicrobiales bacterium]